MPAETTYRDESQAPTREAVDREPGPVLVEFGTSWCGHCRAIQPRVAELLDRHPEVKHVKVEDGPGRPLGRSFHVRFWPSFVFLRGGQVVRQLARPSHAALAEAFEAVAASASSEPHRRA
jgi:thioredoxin 1